MEKVVFKEGTFVDFKGDEREVVFAAVSFTSEGDSVFKLPESKKKRGILSSDYGFAKVVKTLAIGVSVRMSNDEYNAERGRAIAVGKAKKPKSRYAILVTDNKGVINTKVVEALLEQELAFFKQNPGKYIASYDRHKELYEKEAKV